MFHKISLRPLGIAALTTACVGCLTTSSFAVQTPSYNVDFGGGTTYSGTSPANSNDTGTFWNAYNSTSAASLKDSFSNTSSVSLTLSGGTQYFTQSGGSPSPAALMGDYRVLDNTKTGGSLITVTLSGVTDGAYKLYVYAAGDTAGQGANVALDAANQITGGTSSAATTGANQTVTSTSSGVNYVLLNAAVSDLTHVGTGTITFTTSNLTGQRFGGLNGLQLQAVPEPASVGITSIACGLLLRRRRRA